MIGRMIVVEQVQETFARFTPEVLIPLAVLLEECTCSWLKSGYTFVCMYVCSIYNIYICAYECLCITKCTLNVLVFTTNRMEYRGLSLWK